MRDHDEWRRPWPEGAAGLPARTSTEATGAPEAWAVDPVRGLEGAFDVVADAAVDRTAPAQGYAALGATRGAPSDATVDASTSAPVGVSSVPPRAADPAARRRRGFVPGLLGGVTGAVGTVLVLVQLGLVGGADLPGATEQPAGSGQAPAPAPAQPLPPLPDAGLGASVIPDVADRVLPSVVRINASGAVDLTGAGALGSGVVYRSDGYIITNEHVIQGARAVEVLLSDGERYTAEVVGVDGLNDLAVLRIDAEGLPAVDLRPTTEPVRVGETVVAIGSPFGLDATVTSGIISALNRDLRIPSSSEVIPAVIQTDAAINPGNSGGPLVDLQGRLVGINTAIVSRSGTNEGVGFAVPVRQAIVSSDQLIEQGFVRYPLLGITGSDVTPQVAERLGLTNRRGAVVETVQAGSGAELGGLRTGDVITAVDGIALRSMSDLVAEVRRRAPGMTVVFDVLREGEELAIEAVLGERPRS